MNLLIKIYTWISLQPSRRAVSGVVRFSASNILFSISQNSAVDSQSLSLFSNCLKYLKPVAADLLKTCIHTKVTYYY